MGGWQSHLRARGLEKKQGCKVTRGRGIPVRSRDRHSPLQPGTAPSAGTPSPASHGGSFSRPRYRLSATCPTAGEHTLHEEGTVRLPCTTSSWAPTWRHPGDAEGMIGLDAEGVVPLGRASSSPLVPDGEPICLTPHGRVYFLFDVFLCILIFLKATC